MNTILDEVTMLDALNEAARTDAPGTAAQGLPDPAEIASRAAAVSHLLQAHGGGIEIVPSRRPDVVRVRFTGLCTACCLRPLTVNNIINPVFSDLEGVREVEVDGCRISGEALERFQNA